MGRVDVFLTPVQSIYLQSHKPTYKHNKHRNLLTNTKTQKRTHKSQTYNTPPPINEATFSVINT